MRPPVALQEHGMSTATPSYSRVAMGFHWAIALLIFTAFPLGVYMHTLALSPEKLKLISYHKWLGITALALAASRLAWRIVHRPPQLPASLAKWERLGAAATHHLLYVLIFLVPLSGWLMSSAKGFQTVWFGILPLPDLIDKDKELGKLLGQVHQMINYGMIALVGGHVAAALRHHFVAGDEVLVRMAPMLRRPARTPRRRSSAARA